MRGVERIKVRDWLFTSIPLLGEGLPSVEVKSKSSLLVPISYRGGQLFCLIGPHWVLDLEERVRWYRKLPPHPQKINK